MAREGARASRVVALAEAGAQVVEERVAREERRVADALGIPEDVTQTVLLPVAWTRGAVLRRAARKGAAEVAYWNGWGRAREVRGARSR